MHNSVLVVEVFSVVEDIFVGASGIEGALLASQTVSLVVGAGMSLAMELWSLCDTVESMAAGEVPPGAVAKRAWSGPAAASSKGHFIGSCFVRNWTTKKVE